MLRQVIYHSFYSSTKCYLTIEHEGERFIGTLRFDDPTICRFIMSMLKSHIGRSIEDIGGTERCS